MVILLVNLLSLVVVTLQDVVVESQQLFSLVVLIVVLDFFNQLVSYFDRVDVLLRLIELEIGEPSERKEVHVDVGLSLVLFEHTDHVSHLLHHFVHLLLLVGLLQFQPDDVVLFLEDVFVTIFNDNPF